ncbi:MAG: hypothetical protein GX299_06255 [Epulopiscium sp.]|jgi:hypothetical protein|nr:hypothetical protein [Candidatus Epulonipiscium sp.]
MKLTTIAIIIMLNREIRMLIVSLIARILGFQKREYFVQQAHRSPLFYMQK